MAMTWILARWLSILLAFGLSAVAPLPTKAQAPGEVAAYYSNACVSSFSGDIRGYRIALVKRDEGYIVRFQQVQGELPEEAIGKAAVEGDKLTFEVTSTDGKTVTFADKITPQQVIGRFGDGRAGTDGKPEIRWQRFAINVFSTGACPAAQR